MEANQTQTAAFADLSLSAETIAELQTYLLAFSRLKSSIRFCANRIRSFSRKKIFSLSYRLRKHSPPATRF